MSLGDHVGFRTYKYRIKLCILTLDAHAINWAMAIVLMHALHYTDRLKTLSVFSNNATLNFSMFWPRSNASFSRSKSGKLTSETTLVKIIVTHFLITQALPSHARLPTFETLSLNPNFLRSNNPNHGLRLGVQEATYKISCDLEKLVRIYKILQFPEI